MKKWVFLAITIALSCFIVLTSTFKGADNVAAGGRISLWISNVFFGGSLSEAERNALSGVGGKLIAHFSLFAVTGLFAELTVDSFPKIGKWAVVILLAYSMFLSSLGEIVQIFAQERTPTVYDVILDFAGFWFIPLLRTVYRKQK